MKHHFRSKNVQTCPILRLCFRKFFEVWPKKKNCPSFLIEIWNDHQTWTDIQENVCSCLYIQKICFKVAQKLCRSLQSQGDRNYGRPELGPPTIDWLGDARILSTENFGSRLKLNIGNPLLIFNWWGQGNIMWIGKFNWMYLIPFSKLEIIKKFQVSGFLCSVPAVYLLVHPTFGIFGGSRIWGDLFT